MPKRSEDREQVYNTFYSLFCHRENGAKVASDLEEGCWRYAVKCARDSAPGSSAIVEIYSAVAYRILYSLSEELVSEKLWDGLFDGTIDPKTVAEMKPQEYHPQANSDIYAEIERRRAQKIERTVCRLYKCPKCGKNETSPMTYQAAAADEGSTTSIECLNRTCGYVWRLR